MTQPSHDVTKYNLDYSRFEVEDADKNKVFCTACKKTMNKKQKSVHTRTFTHFKNVEDITEHLINGSESDDSSDDSESDEEEFKDETPPPISYERSQECEKIRKKVVKVLKETHNSRYPPSPW